MRIRFAAVLFVLALACGSCNVLPARRPSVDPLMEIAARDPKPFVIVGGGDHGAGQGVVISKDGRVLTAAHVTFDRETKQEQDEVEVSFRKRALDPWPGAVKEHATEIVDAGPTTYYEETYAATVVKKNGKAHIGGGDVGLLKLKTTAELPHIEFYSRKRPEIRIGDRVYLCHYAFPTNAAEPTFLVSPLEVIGASYTTMGVQVLAKGFFRWGSSGSAVLKDGKLIGIQSNAFTVNTRIAGEIPLGHVSFALVYEEMVEQWAGPSGK